MNNIDPSAPSQDYTSQLDRELSVEEVAAIESYNEDQSLLTEASALTAPSSQSAGIGMAQNQPESTASLDTSDIQIQPKATPIPLEPIPIKPIKRRVSGRYSNCPRPWKLELRVDVDGYKPAKMLSGDFYYSSGSTQSYFGSFRVDAPSIYVSDTQVTVIGIAECTWNTSYKKIRVIIPRHTIYQPAANAYVQWYTLTNKKGSEYVCLYDSAYFRTVQLEQDREQGISAFTSYNTGSLPSGGTPRTLTVAKAYAEAGVQIQSAGSANVVPSSDANANHKWSNAELHDAMEKHFSLWKNDPQWKVWLLHANAHEYGTGLLGIMYDQKDKQRQGCASFYQTIDSNSASDLRDQLYVNVHELGHCFNLFHSFHKQYMNPPVPNRPGSLSWMNYPGNYNNGSESGSNAFWAAFPFQFDSLETIHLRHAFRSDIAMGGNPFGQGAAAEGHGSFMDNIRDDTGLELSLLTPISIPLGTPVNVAINLENISASSTQVFTDLNPASSLTQITLQKPNGKVITYHPPIGQCIVPALQNLEPGESIQQSAYIGFDSEEKQLFDMPGAYQLLATYYTPAGEAIRSSISQIRINAPMNQEAEDLAELLLGDEQGMLFFLEGSHSDFLQKGNDAFQEVLERFPNNPLAGQVSLMEGLKASRDFLKLDEKKQPFLIKKDERRSEQLLSSVVSAPEKIFGLTSQSIQHAEQRLSELKSKKGAKIKSRKDASPA